MDVRDIPFQVVDFRTFERTGPPTRGSDGSLAWTPSVPEETMDLNEDMEFAPWCLEAYDQRIGPFTLALDLNVHHAPRVEPSALDRLSAFLGRIEEVDASVRRGVIDGFETLPLVKDYLVPGLLANLERPYLDALFPGITRPEALTPAAFMAGLTFCRLGYYDGSDLNRGGEHVVADYRFLVPSLVGPDLDRADVYLRFGGLYDITNQVIAAKLRLDGTLFDISVES